VVVAAAQSGFTLLRIATSKIDQHALQMLLIFLSSNLFSASTTASVFDAVPVVLLAAPVDEDFPLPPTCAFPPEDGDPVEPELPAVAAEEDAPDEFAVPKVFVPGAVGDFAALPAPLGSFTALFKPPAFAGPLGTPLTAAVPAPAEPALGEPTALPVPAVGPLVAPAADPAEEEPPAEEPPPEPPPPLCARTPNGNRHVASTNTLIVRINVIRESFQSLNVSIRRWFPLTTGF
jgi:hypothetical protein